MRSKVFISYRHLDSDLAERFVAVLESHRIDCWTDTVGMAMSEGFDDRIAQAITS